MSTDLTKEKNFTPDVINDMAEKKFLGNHANESVNIYLTNGTRLDCKIIGYDDNCIIATQSKSGGEAQLVYKSAIATIVPK